MAGVTASQAPAPRQGALLRAVARGAGALAVAGALLAGLALAGDLTLAGLWRAVGQVPAWCYLPIALAQAAILGLAGCKWSLILGGTGGDTPGWRDATAATTLGALGGQVMPIQVVTPLARAWAGRRHGMSPGRAIGTSLLEQVFEVIVLASMALVGVAIGLAGLGPAPGALLALGVAAAMTVLVRPGLGLGAAAFGALSRLGTRRPAQLARALSAGFAQAAHLTGGVLVSLVAMSFARYALLASLNVGILLILVPGVSAAHLFAAYPLVLLVMSLPFVPGGLGVVELTWAGVLIAAGATATGAAEAAVVLRIVSTFGFLLVAPGLLALRGAPAEVRP